MAIIRFINTSAQRCGIGQYGRDLFYEVLCKSKKHGYYFNSEPSLPDLEGDNNDLIIINAPIWMPEWKLKRFPKTKIILIQHWDMINVTQSDFYNVFPNPKLNADLQRCFTTSRLIRKTNSLPLARGAEIPLIGTFGFATVVKHPEWLAKEVMNSFDKAELRLHLPGNDTWADPESPSYRVENMLRGMMPSEKYKISISREYASPQHLLEFLAYNDLNVFFYGPEQLGLSSAVDWAIAAGRPIALNKVPTFSHLFNHHPSPFVDDYPEKGRLKFILDNKDDFAAIREAWTDENLLEEWETIIDFVLER